MEDSAQLSAVYKLPQATQCVFLPPAPHPDLEGGGRLLFQPWGRECGPRQGQWPS